MRPQAASVAARDRIHWVGAGPLLDRSSLVARKARRWLSAVLASAAIAAGAQQPESPPGGGGANVASLPVVSVRDFGAMGDGKSDDWPAFEEALQAARGRQSPAVELWVPPGDYRLSRTLNLTDKIVLRGASTGHGFSHRTTLRFAPNVHGIVVNRGDTLDDGLRKTDIRPGGAGADGSIISQLHLAGGGGERGHGIRLRARASVQQVYVTGFAQDCINVTADARTDNSAYFGNANNWSIQHVRLEHCGRHGLYTDGGDVNAGVAIGIDASGNGGWGIFDSSFLGNTYIAAHTAGNKSGSYKADNPNARNVFIGCYAEGGQPPAEIAPPSLIVGGLFGAVNPDAPQLTGEGGLTTGPVRARINRSQGRPIEIAIGRVVNEALTLAVHGDSSAGLALYWEDDAGLWEWRHARLDGRRAQQFTTDISRVSAGRETVLPAGNTLFPNGLFMGSGPHARYRGVAHQAPVAGDHARGDVVWARDPAAGGPLGWINVDGGAPGTWVPFGQAGHRTTRENPAGTLVPAFVGEEVLSEAEGRWYKSVGNGKADWRALSTP